MTDLRTNAGQEQAVLEQIRSQGGWRVWWATETARRAKTISRLASEGIIAPVEDGRPFPWASYRICDKDRDAA